MRDEQPFQRLSVVVNHSQKPGTLPLVLPSQRTVFDFASCGVWCLTMNREEALELLRGGKKGIAEWNRRQKTSLTWIPDLDSGPDLSKAAQFRAIASSKGWIPDLRGADLRGTTLKGADLRAASLWAAKLAGAKLGKTDLSVADLRDAHLRAADLSEAKLRGADLSRAHLSTTNLSGADLNTAKLIEADLREAKLIEADLSGADLRDAHLGAADLRGAKLIQANLTGAHLRETKLIDADLAGATMCSTVLGNIDISNHNELFSIVHRAASTVGVDTLKHSKGQIPDHFLRGCGLSDWEVLAAKLYDPTLKPPQIAELQNAIFQLRAEGPIYIGGVFISYSSEEAKLADKLYTNLQEKGIRVWLDRHAMIPGPTERQVFDAIRANDVVLLILSESAIKSDWVASELERAREREKQEERTIVCPVTIDDSWESMTSPAWTWLRRERHIADFSKWKTKAFTPAFAKLLKGLKLFYEQ